MAKRKLTDLSGDGKVTRKDVLIGRGVNKAKKGGAVKTKKKSTVNKAGNYTKPGLRKKIFNRIKSQASHGTAAGQWSARKAQAMAKAYKKAGGGYKS